MVIYINKTYKEANEYQHTSPHFLDQRSNKIKETRKSCFVTIWQLFGPVPDTLWRAACNQTWSDWIVGSRVCGNTYCVYPINSTRRMWALVLNGEGKPGSEIQKLWNYFWRIAQAVQPNFSEKCGNVGMAMKMWDFFLNVGIIEKMWDNFVFCGPLASLA